MEKVPSQTISSKMMMLLLIQREDIRHDAKEDKNDTEVRKEMRVFFWGLRVFLVSPSEQHHFWSNRQFVLYCGF